MRSSFINLFFSLLFPLLSFSENSDSLLLLKKNSITKFFTENQFEFTDSLSEINNSLTDFQYYLERNHLGNSGLPYNFLFPSLSSETQNFNYSKNNYQNYFFLPEKQKFYNTRTPFTDLFYVIGSKKEQDFKMTFSYNVKKNWNVTADFFRIRSVGFYYRQNTDDNFITLSSNYKSTNNRYYILGSIIYNSAKNSENGGITSDSLFENEKNTDKGLSEVNLASAKRSIENRSFFIKQYFNFGRKENDSIASIIPSSRIIFSSKYEDNHLKYDDEDPFSGYYANVYIDSFQTSDLTIFSKIENEIVWKRVDNRQRRGLRDILGVGLSLKDQFVKIKQKEIDSVFNNIIVGAQFYNTYSNNKFWWHISGNYCLTGYNKDDYFGNAVFKKGLRDSGNVFTLSVSTKLNAPDFIYNSYSSNHFKWNNNFQKVSENSIQLSFCSRKYSFNTGFNFFAYLNPLYFDSYAISKQYVGVIPVMSVFLKKNFSFHNWHLNNKINYQYVQDSCVIRLPKFVLEHSLYYENEVLKNAALIQLGVSMFYTSSYFANAYMPATAQFYLQDEKKYGNYPFIDFFFNAQVKNIRIFFKVDHLNSGMMGDTYIQTPGNPMNGRAFKIGFSWRFFD
jgi:hypothetical protein